MLTEHSSLMSGCGAKTFRNSQLKRQLEKKTKNNLSNGTIRLTPKIKKVCCCSMKQKPDRVS